MFHDKSTTRKNNATQTDKKNSVSITVSVTFSVNLETKRVIIFRLCESDGLRVGKRSDRVSPRLLEARARANVLARADKVIK